MPGLPIILVNMEFKPIQPDLVRFEMRLVKGEDPHSQAQKRPGRFGRFLSGVGKVLGAAAMPMSFIFPPAAIAAAGLYGVGQIGDQSQARANQRTMENIQRQQMTTVSFPGLNTGGSGITPAAATIPGAAGDSQVMDVLYQRDSAAMEMSHGI